MEAIVAGGLQSFVNLNTTQQSALPGVFLDAAGAGSAKALTEAVTSTSAVAGSLGRSRSLNQAVASVSTLSGSLNTLAYTTYLDNALLAHAIGETAYPMPANYMALFKVAPTPAGGGTETTYSNYARVAVSGAFGTVSAGSVSNTSPITLPTCGATGDSIVAFGAFDALTGGNLLYFGTCAVTVSSGIAPTFAAGALTVSQS